MSDEPAGSIEDEIDKIRPPLSPHRHIELRELQEAAKEVGSPQGVEYLNLLIDVTPDARRLDKILGAIVYKVLHRVATDVYEIGSAKEAVAVAKGCAALVRDVDPEALAEAIGDLDEADAASVFEKLRDQLFARSAAPEGGVDETGDGPSDGPTLSVVGE